MFQSYDSFGGIVTRMPQKIFVATEILVFDFELFIGGRCDLLGNGQRVRNRFAFEHSRSGCFGAIVVFAS